jgi:hypothetical protein
MSLFVYLRVGVQTGVGRYTNALFVPLFLVSIIFFVIPRSEMLPLALSRRMPLSRHQALTKPLCY